MTKYFVSCLLLSVFIAQPVFAADKLRGDVFCFPVKDVSKIVDNLKKVDESRRDIVDVAVNPKFIIKDGGVWPERFYLRTQTSEVEVPIEKPSGLTPTFLTQAYAYPQSDVCVADKSRAMRPEFDEGLYFEMGLSPLYHNRSGHHDMKELKEGTKDGKAFYKKMIPSVVRMFMPDSNYLAVKYEDMRLANAQIFASVDGQDIPLAAELYKEMHVISFKALEDMKAQALIVKGGTYHLQPTVSVATMKKFGFGQEEDES